MASRIGIFGGSFDPIHLGHLWIAESAIESLALDHLRWIPASTSPLKPAGPVASDEDRLDMIRLSVSGLDKHVVDDREIQRSDISYTLNTLDDLRAEFPEAELMLIIGSDSLSTFPRWHQPERLLQLATMATVQRGGEPEIDFDVLQGLAEPDQIERARQSVIKMPVIEISSGEIRQRIAAGRTIRFRVARAVEAKIDAEQLYRAKTAPGI